MIVNFTLFSVSIFALKEIKTPQTMVENQEYNGLVRYAEFQNSDRCFFFPATIGHPGIIPEGPHPASTDTWSVADGIFDDFNLECKSLRLRDV